MHSVKNNLTSRFIEMVDEFSHQINILRCDEIVPSVDWRPVEKPMNLSSGIRVHHAFNLCLQARAGVNCGTNDFDFWRD